MFLAIRSEPGNLILANRNSVTSGTTFVSNDSAFWTIMPFKIASNWASYTVELKKLSFSLWNDVLHYFIRTRGFFPRIIEYESLYYSV